MFIFPRVRACISRLTATRYPVDTQSRALQDFSTTFWLKSPVQFANGSRLDISFRCSSVGHRAFALPAAGSAPVGSPTDAASAVHPLATANSTSFNHRTQALAVALCLGAGYAAAFTSANADAASIALRQEKEGKDAYAPAIHDNVAALESLLLAFNDPEKHDALVKAGAIDQLVHAYQKGKVDSAVNVNVLRTLADLASKDSNHIALMAANAPELLVSVLLDCQAAAASNSLLKSLSSWIPEWAASRLGLLPSTKVLPSQEHREQAPQNSHPVAPILGNSGTNQIIPSTPYSFATHTGSTAATNNSVSIRDGVVYHAVRCLANLARNTACHAPLIACGTLGPMISILSQPPLHLLSSVSSPTAALADVVGYDEQAADTIRFATLCVAALSKTAAQDVTTKRGHRPLIALLGQSVDSVAQTYAAGGIRNLARHASQNLDGTWRVHRDLVVDGLPSALATGLRATSNPKAQAFAALAVGDVLTTGHYKANVICKRMTPTFEPFSHLLLSGNAAVAKAAYRAVDVVFSNSTDVDETRLSVEASANLQAFCRAIKEVISSFVNAPGSRYDPGAISTMAAMSLDDTLALALVEKGAIPILINAMRLKGDAGLKSTIALARLTARPEGQSIALMHDGISACSTRSLPSEDCRWESAMLANFARDERSRLEVAHTGLILLLRAISSKAAAAQREGSRGLFNITIGGASRVVAAHGGALASLAALAESTNDPVTRRHAVGAISSISELPEFGEKIVEIGGISMMRRAAEKDPKLSRDVARCFGQLSNHVESHHALASEGAAVWLVDVVSRGDSAPDTLHHATSALVNISYSNGKPRETLRKAGAAAALTGLATGIFPPTVAHCARLALMNLRGSAAPCMQHADPQGPVDPV